MTMTYQARTVAARQAFMGANEREPQVTDWGLLVSDGSVTAPASDFRFFAWFETRGALLDFIASDLVLSAGQPPAEADAQILLGDVTALVAKVRDGGMGLDALAQAAAGCLTPGQTLNWAGTFEDLCTGDGAAVSDVRAAFWCSREDDHDQDGPQPPIGQDDHADFLEFLQTFGV